MTLAIFLCIMQALMFAVYVKFGSNLKALKRERKNNLSTIAHQSKEIRRLQGENYSARFRGVSITGKDF